MKEVSQPQVIDYAGSFFTIIVLGCMAGGIYLVCSGIINDDRARKEKERATLVVPVDENGGLFRIIHTYPAYNGKGHLIGHIAVAEGIKTGKRVSANVNPLLPIPGEVWEMTVEAYGHLIRYKFVRKVNLIQVRTHGPQQGSGSSKEDKEAIPQRDK